MPYSTALTKLRDAIAVEHDTIQAELKSHLAVYEKMALYQREGIEMSAAEHDEWAVAVQAVAKIRELQGRPIKRLVMQSGPPSVAPPESRESGS